MNDILIGALKGCGGGIVYGISGITSKGKEKFEWLKVVPTLIVSTVIGGVAGLLNMEYGVVADMSVSAGITAVIQKFYKAIFK